MKVILFGQPGVGKGTTAKMLAEKYNFPHLNVGHMLRLEIDNDSELGKSIEPYVTQGLLVPDKLINDLVKAALTSEKSAKGFFLDGYPRTIDQAKFLEGITKIDAVLSLYAPKKIVVERIKARAEGRFDDTPEIVGKRFDEYKEKTEPVIDYYRNEGILIDIDSIENEDGVFNQCVESLDSGDQ